MVTDSLATGRNFLVLGIVDSFTREFPATWADGCLGWKRVRRVLDRVIAERGRPTAIRCYNGAEFTSRHFLSACEKRQTRLVFIEPGRSMKNGRIESINGLFRGDCLNANWFLTWADARAKIEFRRTESNSETPHSGPGYLWPWEFAARQLPRGDSAGMICGQGE